MYPVCRAGRILMMANCTYFEKNRNHQKLFEHNSQVLSLVSALISIRSRFKLNVRGPELGYDSESPAFLGQAIAKNEGRTMGIRTCAFGDHNDSCLKENVLDIE